MVKRFLQQTLQNASHSRFVLLRGPKSIGKTTLCQTAFPAYLHHDLRDSEVCSELLGNPKGFLACYDSKKHKGMILDHLERLTEQESKKLARAMKAIMADVSLNGFQWVFVESRKSSYVFHKGILRNAYIVYDLLPLSYGEIVQSTKKHLSFGETLFYGSSARDYDMAGYMDRLIERHDFQENAVCFDDFIKFLANWVSYPLDKSQLAKDCAISESVLEDWLKILEEEFIIFPLPPLKDRLRTHLAKRTKYYFYDTAFLCWLLGVSSPQAIGGHLDAYYQSTEVFRNWVVAEIVKARSFSGDLGGCYYYEDSKKRRADMIINYPSQSPIIVHVDIGRTALLGIMGRSSEVRDRLKEIKGITPSLEIVYGGDESYKWTHHRFLSWKHLISTDFSANGDGIFLQEKKTKHVS